jgi:hypothetical protein
VEGELPPAFSSHPDSTLDITSYYYSEKWRS